VYQWFIRVRKVLNPKRAFILMGVAVVLACLALRERTYDGETFDHWFEDYVHNPAGGAQSVFRHHSEKAVPFLVGKLTRQESNWRKWYRHNWVKVPGVLQQVLPLPKYAPTNSPTAIGLLGEVGPPARAAVPEIIQYLRARERGLMDVPEAPSTLLFDNMHTNGIMDVIRLPRYNPYRQSSLQQVENSLNTLDQIGPEITEFIPLLLEVTQWMRTLDTNAASKPQYVWDSRGVFLSTLPSLAFTIDGNDNLFFTRLVGKLESPHWHASLRAALPVLMRNLSNTNGLSRFMAIAGIAQLVPEVDESVPPCLKHSRRILIFPGDLSISGSWATLGGILISYSDS
jgi:hypothetical protein